MYRSVTCVLIGFIPCSHVTVVVSGLERIRRGSIYAGHTRIFWASGPLKGVRFLRFGVGRGGASHVDFREFNIWAPL